jgi:t-SNARE complex subunit (syntaxin)
MRYWLYLRAILAELKIARHERHRIMASIAEVAQAVADLKSVVDAVKAKVESLKANQVDPGGSGCGQGGCRIGQVQPCRSRGVIVA